MHEMSIAQALVEAVEKELAAYPDARVQTVHVRVGRLRLVEPLTLDFCFRCAVEATPLAGSTLELEEVPASAVCDTCRTEFTVDDAWFECPSCHALNARLRSGKELDLVSIDLEEVWVLEKAGLPEEAAVVSQGEGERA